MKPLKLILVPAALAVVLAATPAFAQTPTPAQTPATQTPATQTPAVPPAQTPAATPQPPRPFPQGAKTAWINMQAIASTSAAGKEASKRLQDMQGKKNAEIQDKQKQLQAMQAKLQQGGAILNDAARSQLEKDIDKLQRDIQFSTQNAQAEWNDLQNELQAAFQKQLNPIIEQIATEKGLQYVFSIQDSGAIWADPSLDLSAEVIKRLNAATPPATVKK